MLTQVILDHDLDWLETNFLPLSMMRTRISSSDTPDPGVLKGQRIAALSTSPWTGHIISKKLPMLPFLRRYAGGLMLIKLLQPHADTTPGGVTLRDLGARFAVSHTHIRKLLEEAEGLGLLALTGTGRRQVRLPPFVCHLWPDSVTAHELTHHMELAAMAGSQ